MKTNASTIQPEAGSASVRAPLAPAMGLRRVRTTFFVAAWGLAFANASAPALAQEQEPVCFPEDFQATFVSARPQADFIYSQIANSVSRQLFVFKSDPLVTNLQPDFNTADVFFFDFNTRRQYLYSVVDGQVTSCQAFDITGDSGVTQLCLVEEATRVGKRRIAGKVAVQEFNALSGSSRIDILARERRPGRQIPVRLYTLSSTQFTSEEYWDLRTRIPGGTFDLPPECANLGPSGGATDLRLQPLGTPSREKGAAAGPLELLEEHLSPEAMPLFFSLRRTDGVDR